MPETIGSNVNTSTFNPEIATNESTELISELAEMSQVVLALASVVSALLGAHETLGAAHGEELVAKARDLHHRLQARAYMA